MAQWKSQESELAKLAETLEARRTDLDRDHADLAGARHEWDQRMAELDAARESIAALQAELERKVTEVSSRRDDLRVQYEPRADRPGGALPASGGVPQAEATDRESLGRFQKLCRDARRRVVGP